MIHEADPDIVEEWKWMGTPVWSHAGNICTGESYKQVVKLTFARVPPCRTREGSSIPAWRETRVAPSTSTRERRSTLGRSKRLIQAAVAENLRSRAAKSKSAPKSKSPVKPTAKARQGAKAGPAAKAKSDTSAAKPVKPRKGDKGAVVLLPGGNPQIAKADGDAPVQAYIAAMPGWKGDLGKRLDALIVRSVPQVRKAVKWNSPFYGLEGQGWFLAFHVFTRYVKVSFFRGTSLRPVPPAAPARTAAGSTSTKTISTSRRWPTG